jgi:hypothetical protein
LNSVFTQYEELSSPQFAVFNLRLRLRLITANLGLDNSSYRAPPHSIIVNYRVIFYFQIIRSGCREICVRKCFVTGLWNFKVVFLEILQRGDSSTQTGHRYMSSCLWMLTLIFNLTLTKQCLRSERIFWLNMSWTSFCTKV